MRKKEVIIALIMIQGIVITNGQALISRLETVDVETLQREVVREFEGRIEAPNWTPDGKWLVYNSGGQIYKIPVKGGEPEHISTGEVVGCNNDHVISADGKLLSISANGPVSHSQIYILPFEGGDPDLVTPKGPSYLHGISPDSKYLAYCANRNGNYDVYVIPTKGGEEIRLTDQEGLDDGPEYSPDGKYIWFNSVRSGLMQAWRMKADGSEQTQMTFDEANNWFPHISPDGKKVVVITYKKGHVEPGAHPPNKQVELRMMPAGGGDLKTLVSLFGGQGTINVNSWSPDSKKIAFVSYELDGIFESSDDVGEPKLKGSAVHDKQQGTYTLTGAGENMWAGNDQFHFAWKRVTGDFSLSARIEFVGEGVNVHRKMGIMVRESLEGNAPHANVVVHGGDGLTSLQYRMEKGAETLEKKAEITGADHILLERKGDMVIIRTGKGELPTDASAKTEISLPKTCFVGLFICSHEEDVIEKGIFHDVTFLKE